MNFHFLFILFVSSSFVLQQSCNKDTCNDIETFVEMDANLLADTSSVKLELQWTQGKFLPKSYFDAYFIYEAPQDRFGIAWQNDFELIDTLTMISTTGLNIELSEEAETNLPRDVFLHFIFPDRRQFIGCDHPGSNDDYHLDISFQLFENTASIQMRNFTWKETLIKGELKLLKQL